MDSTRFREAQAYLIDDELRFAPGEEALRLQFEQLALETYEAVIAATTTDNPADLIKVGPFSLDENFLEYGQLPDLVPRSLLDRWRNWQESYQRLLEKHPALTLYKMMEDIGRTIQLESWPHNKEAWIQDWLDADQFYPLGFRDIDGILTPEFWSRMRTLRKRAGGWFYFKDIESGVVFLPEEKWQQLRASIGRIAAAPVLSGRRKSTFKMFLGRLVKRVLTWISALAFVVGLVELLVPWLANEHTPGPMFVLFGGILWLLASLTLFAAAWFLALLRKRR